MIKKIKIGPFVYTIRYRNEFISVRKDTETGADYAMTGHIDYLLSEIEISTNTQKDMLPVTLLHEVIHGLLYNAGFQDQDQLENIIETISIGLYGVIKENKAVREWVGNNFSNGDKASKPLVEVSIDGISLIDKDDMTHVDRSDLSWSLRDTDMDNISSMHKEK